ncbi:MAG: hypothetical protein U0637_01405 [Phycisphaerales bacterium]
MRSKTFARLTALSTAAVAATLVGCGSSNKAADGGRLSAIQSDVTPELMTQSQRHVDVDNEVAMTWDGNSRMMWADLHRFFLNDRPSLLTGMPTPY